MGRPTKTGLEWCKHPTAGGEALDALEAMHGDRGYVFHWKLMERIYANGDALDLSHHGVLTVVVAKLRMDMDTFTRILEDALSLGIFDRDMWQTRHILTSEAIKENAKGVQDGREAAATRKALERERKRIAAENALKAVTRDNQNVTRDNSLSDNAIVTRDNAIVTRESAQIRSDQIRSEKEIPPLSPPRGAISFEFETARREYPGKVRDYKAEHGHFIRTCRKHGDDPAAILPLLGGGIERYKAHLARERKKGRDPILTSMANWITRREWTAAYPGEQHSATHKPPEQLAAEAAREAMQRQADSDATARKNFLAYRPEQREAMREKERQAGREIPAWMAEPDADRPKAEAAG